MALPFGGHPQLRAFRHKKTVVGGREAKTYGSNLPKCWARAVYKKNEKLVLHLQPLRTSFKGNGKTCGKSTSQESKGLVSGAIYDYELRNTPVKGYRLPTDKLSVNWFLTDYRPIRNYTESYRSYR